ncbi:MAG: transposase, partial [Moorea sp. SIO2I5]|nr:transposase [Moorena sp. SIO2I5]
MQRGLGGFPHERLHQDNEKDLTKKQSQKLAQVKEVSPTLKTMHELKEKIRQIFDETNDWLGGLFKLG